VWWQIGIWADGVRAVHVIPAVSEEASGPSYSVVRLCESLVEVGQVVELAALDWSPIARPPDFLKVFPMGRGPKRLGRSPAMWRWLRDEIRSGRADITHSHGMWQMNAVYPGLLAFGGKTRLVVSPRGAFSGWAMSHGSRLKKIVWPLVQRPAVNFASCFHATAVDEHADIRHLGFRQPVAVIPNGIDVPPLVRNPSTPVRTLLFLGRIHPKKGIDLLLHAWSRVMRRFPDWQLRIAGTDVGYGGGGYLATMRALAASLRLERCEFIGPRYGADKLAAYRAADLFVLPTHSENFGLTVAEAQAAGTPVIVSKGAPWAGVHAAGSGWWVDIGDDALAACLENALGSTAHDLSQRGLRGRDWMLRDYAWPAIASQMHQTYRWLIEGGTTPSWVRLD
jgi:glycosyltransferase involved in cell wall biosynthesis